MAIDWRRRHVSRTWRDDAPMPLASMVRVYAARLMQLYAGLTLYGIATALRVRAGLGLDPWGTLHQGLSRTTGLSFGEAMLLVGLAILLLWIPLRHKPGFGTISNIVVVGIATDAALHLLPAAHLLAIQIACTLLGTLLTALAAATYISSGFGTGPRDGLMIGLALRTGWPIRRTSASIERLAQ